MNTTLVWLVFAAWLVFVPALFRLVGPRRAILIGVFGGFLLLPREADALTIFSVLSINKRVVSGLALLLGVLIFDRRPLIQGRPRWLDLPMAGFLLMPLVSLAVNQFQGSLGSIDQVWRNAFEWGMPYLVGRLYLGDRDTPGDLLAAIVISGLVYVPICVFEMVVGPQFYLLGLIYKIPVHGSMVSRMGGWRPEGFLTNGIELTTWMALSATSAAWLWLRRGWSPWKAPTWSPSLTLSVVTLACRGVYGYIDLAIGLAVAGLSNLLKTRFVIAALMVLPPLYIGVRTSGLWDGQSLVQIASKFAKAETVSYRLRAEDSYLKNVFDHGPWFGFGGIDSAIFDFYAQAHLWPDGWWIHQIRAGGIVGLTLFLAAFFLIPAGLGLALPAGRSGQPSPGALAWGLSLFLVLHMIDSLQNMAYLTPTPLIGGALIAVFQARRTNRLDIPPIPHPDLKRNWDRKLASRIPLLITIAILIVFEFLGSLQRTPRSEPDQSARPDGPATP